MKRLLVLAAAALVGAAALADTPAGGWPRVYQYAASLNTAVARNAKTVTYADCDRAPEADVCYRVKGKVSIKGVIVFGCACVDEEEYDSLPDGYPIILMATSADNYRGVTFAKGDVWTANRLGSPLSSKAKVAELGFDTEFRSGPTNAGACVRDFELSHAGFGTVGMVESGDGYDITSISGAVIGSALAPYCSAEQNTCPRCEDNGECKVAIAFEPCTVDDCAPYDGENTETGVAFGSFTVKYNKTLASAIKNIPTEEIQETIDVLVPKVFGKNAIAPTYANYDDYFGYSVTQYYGARIEHELGFADFDSLPTGTAPYVEGGMRFWIFGEGYSQYTGCNGDSDGFYLNGGGSHPTQILRADGGDFTSVEFIASDGWSSCYNYGIVQAYRDGTLIATFYVEGSANSTVYGFTGRFDELRVAFFNGQSARDAGNINGYSAGAIDHVRFGRP